MDRQAQPWNSYGYESTLYFMVFFPIDTKAGSIL